MYLERLQSTCNISCELHGSQTNNFRYPKLFPANLSGKSNFTWFFKELSMTRQKTFGSQNFRVQFHHGQPKTQTRMKDFSSSTAESHGHLVNFYSQRPFSRLLRVTVEAMAPERVPTALTWVIFADGACLLNGISPGETATCLPSATILWSE